MSEKTKALPCHLAIIMDGNGRWAQARGLARSRGHEAGAENVYSIVAECRRIGIRYLTLYAFSSENWNRPQNEIRVLFNLLTEFLHRFLPLMQEQKIRLNVLGNIEELPFASRKALRYVLDETKSNEAMVLNLAINYGGRQEIVRAVQSFVAEGRAVESITEEEFSARLYTAGQPDPDLLIRTSGEQRLSNYLLYQCAYSELYFTPIPWPDFSVHELHKALEEYAHRNRRFGKTQEQVIAENTA